METFLSFHFQVFVWPQRFLGEFLAQESHREVILALGKKEPLLKRKSHLEIVLSEMDSKFQNFSLVGAEAATSKLYFVSALHFDQI